MTQSKKQVLGFDEWWEENYMNVSADRTEAEDIYNLGAQSRQEEVSELQAEVDCLNVKLKGENERALMLLNHKNNMVDKMQGEISKHEQRRMELANDKMKLIKQVDELQKRIDSALELVNMIIRKDLSDANILKIKDILK